MSLAMCLTAVFVWSTATVALAACPFCPPSGPTLAEKLAECDAAVLVQWVRAVRAENEEDDPRTDFSVREVIRDRDNKFPPGTTISVNYLRRGQPGDQFVFYGKQTEDGWQWQLPLEVTEVTYGYLKQCPSPEQPTAERLRYYQRFLDARDPFLSNDAFAEFSRAPYADVATIATSMSAEKIRGWLDNPQTDPVRLGFFALLLGLAGEPADAGRLWDRVAPHTKKDEVRLGNDGMMGAYVLLTGPAGLERLLEAKVRAADSPDADVYAVVNALRFLWESAEQRVPRAKVVAGMREILRRPALAEIALTDLARWQAWEAAPDVFAWHGRNPFDVPETQAKLVQFARVCLKSDPPPAAMQAATAYLMRLEQTEPETWQAIERILSPRPRKPQSLRSNFD